MLPQMRSAGRRPPRAGRTRSPSAIIKRKPLSPTARRHGWVGCNFNLNRIPADARIGVVTESQISPATEVREKFKRVKPLKDISVTQRGWTLDVLNIVRRISEVGTAGSAVRAPSGRNVPAALPPGT
ncbi:MAG: DpnI domain-containing protein, partial [Verrucomicrobiia bacterium]